MLASYVVLGGPARVGGARSVELQGRKRIHVLLGRLRIHVLLRRQDTQQPPGCGR